MRSVHQGRGRGAGGGCGQVPRPFGSLRPGVARTVGVDPDALARYVLDDALQEPYKVQKHRRAIYFLYTSCAHLNLHTARRISESPSPPSRTAVRDGGVRRARPPRMLCFASHKQAHPRGHLTILFCRIVFRFLGFVRGSCGGRRRLGCCCLLLCCLCLCCLCLRLCLCCLCLVLCCA